MSEVILKVESLHKFFGDNHVLRGIDLEVKRGQTVCMIGSSGSGKSTFLRCINFMEYPSAGRLTIHGKVIGREDGSLEGAPVSTIGNANWSASALKLAWCFSSSISSLI
jgi:polar amino acid transport system ATP-binding protein